MTRTRQKSRTSLTTCIMLQLVVVEGGPCLLPGHLQAEFPKLDGAGVQGLLTGVENHVRARPIPCVLKFDDRAVPHVPAVLVQDRQRH